MSEHRRYQPGTYEEMSSSFRWEVPDRYNIAVDTVDKHPSDRLAMVWEDWRGNERSVTFGDIEAMSSRIANVLFGLGVERGDRVAHRLSDSQSKVLITDGANRGRLEAMKDRVPTLERVLVFDAGNALVGDDVDLDEAMAGASADFSTADTAADDPAQLYYTSGTTGQAKGILHAHRYALAHNEFEFCHDVRVDEVFHSTGEWAWIAGIVPGLLGPWRFGVPVAVFQRHGAYDPEQTLYVLEKYRGGNIFSTPTAL